MRMNDDAARFSPQIAALAMPQESEFKAAADGIANVGKVFLDAEERKQASALNMLKMDVAKEELTAKKFDNSIAGEEWENQKTTYALDRRNKSLEALKKQLDYDSEVKKAGELEVTQKISGMLPSTMFYKEGKFDRSSLDNTRTAWLNDPQWKGKEHVVNAVFDGKLKEITSAEEALLKNSKTQSEINNKNEETKWIAPKANAEIDQKKSATVKNYAGANLDNVNASQVPIKTAAYVEQTKTSAKNLAVETDKLKRDRQKIVADDKLGSMVPGWDGYDEAAKRFVINRYITDGMLPSSSREVVVKKGVFGDDVKTQPLYPKGSLGNDVPKVIPKPVATQPKSAGGSIPVGTIKTNQSTGQKAQFDGKGWVLVQ